MGRVRLFIVLLFAAAVLLLPAAYLDYNAHDNKTLTLPSGNKVYCRGNPPVPDEPQECKDFRAKNERDDNIMTVLGLTAALAGLVLLLVDGRVL